MGINNDGLDKVAENFAGDITKGQWGEGTTEPEVTDTGLETPVTATLLDVTATNSGNSSQFTHTVGSGTANGTSLTEFELQFADGTSFNRTVGGTVNKSSSNELVTISTISFVRTT